ncbi:MAG: hypothetical protein ACLUNZ_00570 [Evtepia sp.]
MRSGSFDAPEERRRPDIAARARVPVTAFDGLCLRRWPSYTGGRGKFACSLNRRATAPAITRRRDRGGGLRPGGRPGQHAGLRVLRPRRRASP